MKLTNYLLAAILIVLLMRFYPGALRWFAFAAVVGGIAYGAYWLITQYPVEKAKREQEKRDDDEYWDYEAKHREIRAKYDPNNVWNEATNVPREYLEEIRSLNKKHAGMLMRRNGWSAADFDD